MQAADLKRINIGVLASGRGTNLEAIIAGCEEGLIDGRVVIVISDVKDAPALERARRHGIYAQFIDPRGFQTKAEYEAEIVNLLKDKEVDLVALAGYMRIVGPTLLKAYPQRIMNIHPALLPAFPGLDAQRKAWEYGVKISGCTVHFVDEGMDTGPIILQAAVPVAENDTPESLADKILEQEHIIYPKAIQLFAQGKLEIQGRRVRIRE